MRKSQQGAQTQGPELWGWDGPRTRGPVHSLAHWEWPRNGFLHLCAKKKKKKRNEKLYSVERDGQIPPLLLKEEKKQTNSCSCSPEESEQKEKRSSAPRSCGGAGDVQLTLSGETFLGRRGKKEPHVRQHVPNAAQSNILGDPSLQDFSEPFTY